MFHALGYNVEPTDYSPGLKIKYDRRLFTEFNSRKSVDTRLTLLGVLPLYTIHVQPRHDPFQFISAAILKDGTRVSSIELKAMLLNPSDRTDGSEKAKSQIDYLITVPANVQVKESRAQNIGPWDFSQLGHEHLRELRGAGLLAAWIGLADSRFDNTRLKAVKNGGTTELKHFFTDLGGGLGKANGIMSHRPEDVEAFPLFFTEPELRQGKGKMTIPFRIVNFQPIERTPAFEQMTIDDARWMARLIAQLTEQQIVDALTTSGFDSGEVRVVSAKLRSRREKMLRDLELRSPAREKLPAISLR